MPELNEEFLVEVGLADLPEAQRGAFLEHVHATLEQRTGEVLSDGLTDDELREFEGIIDHDTAKVDAWLAANAPDYRNDEIYGRIAEATGLVDGDPVLLAEYAATKWLEVKRPNYRETVAKIVTEIKADIVANRDAILAAG